MVRGPAKPSARRVSAALCPAREAPTITMRPWALKSARKSSLCIWPCPVPTARRVRRGDPDGLNGARGRRGPHPIALRRLRGGVVPEGFLSVQLEDLGGEETALGVALAAIEINHNLEGLPRLSRHARPMTPSGGSTLPDRCACLSWKYPERDRRRGIVIEQMRRCSDPARLSTLVRARGQCLRTVATSGANRLGSDAL